MVNIMIAEDQKLIRESLKIILNSQEDYEVTACVENGEQVLQVLEQQHIDIILMDIRMPIMDGVECTRIVKERCPDVYVLILTTFVEDELIKQSLLNGASGYILKGISLQELKNAIDTILQGGSILDPDVAQCMVSILQKTPKKAETQEMVCAESGVEMLSRREWNIIQLIADGLSNREIANKLVFTEGTIRNYLSVILEKLQLRDRTQLAIWYLQSGIQVCPCCECGNHGWKAG